MQAPSTVVAVTPADAMSALQRPLKTKDDANYGYRIIIDVNVINLLNINNSK